MFIYIQYPPSAIIKKESDGTFSYDGTAVEILKYLAQAFNVT